MTLLAISAYLDSTARQFDPPAIGDSRGTPESEPHLASQPMRLEIPAIGLSTRLDRIAMKADGTIEDPASFDRPSWYGWGPSPGDHGSAVILGHVDSARAPAVFFALDTLAPGDTVEVTRADGTTAEFVVDRTQLVPKTDFPNTAVYGDHGDSELQLVTCGGEFDSIGRTYLSNFIVYTKFTGWGREQLG
ncbi:class F sortase [Nocardia yamanashiensis]|uniref:class F sortase n=1 Tax=Nocardia yamanashiensis TaxID=209247 RepID=UPI001E5841D0|nr:class F sortase [Nocardia yamanashiensis]UGT43184.1 class F sortase [Nocardia yamanashiensis]